MLSPANADLVHRDTPLPGLATVLDPEAFLAALTASAPEAALRAAQLRYLRYKPGQNCRAAYTLELKGQCVECYAKAYGSADAMKLAKSSLRSTTSAGPLGHGRFVWPGSCVEVCVFPNDNKVKSLALMADASRREDFLRRHLPGHPALWGSQLRPLAYKPERRWVGALELNGQPQAVCKLYTGAAFGAVRSKSNRIAPGDVLRLAPLLGQSKGRCALFFGWRDGRLLSEALLEPAFDPAVLRRLGIALAELHRQKISSLPLVSRQAEAASLLELSPWLSFLLPKAAERMMSVAQRLARNIGGLPQRKAVIHGDFNANQVLLGGETLTLLDLDEAGRGDPLSDLGTFLAHVERDVICGRLAPSQRDGIREALLAGYGSGAADIVAPRELELYVAGKLFARMPHFFRTCDPDWPVLTMESLARVESLLIGVGKQPERAYPSRSASEVKLAPNENPAHPMAAARAADGTAALRSREASGAVARRGERETPNLSRALDLAEAGPLLESALREHDPGIAAVSVRYARLRRHKPGRRALIEYGLEYPRNHGRVLTLTMLGKLRRRGLDADNLDYIGRLLANGFSAESTDRISIPAILGRVPELGMWLQQKVSGRPAAELLGTPAGPAVARRAAEVVCKLHRCHLPFRRVHTIADELNLLEERLGIVAAQRPAWQGRLADLAAACARLAADLPVVPPRPIHRDFYHDQLLFDGEQVWLVDLDLLCAGDPALDAGNFVGHLLEWTARSPADRSALAKAASAFTDRHLELTAGEAGKAIDTYATLTLARHVFISTQFPDRTPFTETILKLCEERCGLARTEARGVAFADSTP